MIGPLGMQELLIIMGVALIVFGPRKLPQIGKTLGNTVREFRSQSQQLRNTLEREVQMEDFRKAREEVTGLGRDVAKGLDPNAETPSGPGSASGGAPPKTERAEASAAKEGPANGSGAAESATASDAEEAPSSSGEPKSQNS